MTKESKHFSSPREGGGRGDDRVEGQEKIYEAGVGKCFAPSSINKSHETKSTGAPKLL